jgi:hypothetical protein
MKKLHFLVALLIISFSGNAQWYTIQPCTYSVIPGTGTALPACDDCMSGMVPIGFTFPFYGQNYTQCDISSNGWLTFNSGMPSVYPGQTMPYATIPTMIAWSWDDMYTVGATFNYFTTGTAPNRIFVVNYNNVGYCCASANQATVQIQLYETTGEIRMVSANNNHTGRTATMGLQNTAVGSITYPGRNASSWSSAANECVSWMYTPPASALNFDNNNDYVSCATTSALNITGAITLEAWVNRSANGSDDCIIGKDNWAANNGYSLWVFSNNRACMRFGNIANFSLSTITPGVWTHIAATYSAGTMRMYINGVLDATFTGVPNPASNTGNLYLGTPQDAVGNPLYTFNGSMDEVRIWNRALSQYEIQQTMNCEIPTTSSGLLANYHFNEGIASMNNAGVVTLPDATGNGFTGTLSNFALIGSTSNWIAPGGVTNSSVCCALVSSSVTAQTNVSCNGGTNGTATVTATGGTSFTYSWAPSGGTGATGTGLAAGTYTCTVTNQCGNTNTATVTITQPSAISVTAASQTNISCNGGTNGAASINTPTGGAGGYTYNWTPGNPTGDGTVSVTGLTAGTWTCTVTDANSCTATQTFNITAPTALVLNALSQTNVSCFGGSNGAAAVSPASGGAGGYTYNWTPGNPTGDGTTSVTGLVAGTWTCTVTDANSCTTTRTFNITSPTALVATAASQTNISCNGGSNGAASINTPTGGAGGYTYNWTPGNPTGDGTVSVTGLTAGSWTCTVTDANSCTATQTFNITAPSAITANISSTSTSCVGNTGTASVSAVAGGAGGYTYSWAPSGGTAATATGLAAGTYTCTITDANACTITRTVTVTTTSGPSLTALSQTNVSCFGGTNGAACVNNATGGTAPYTYNWTPGNPTGDGTTCVSGLTAGTWSCTVTDANNCTALVTFNITSPSAVSLTATATPTVICSGQSSTLSAGASGGSGSFTYLWMPGSMTSASTSVSPTVTTTYTVTATDANACTAVTVLTVSVNPLPAVALSGTNHFCPGGSTLLTGTSGGTSQWYLNGVAIVGATSNTYLATMPGVYNMIKTNTNGCFDSSATGITVTVDTPPSISSITSTPVACFGDNNGSATVTATGTPSLTYAWAPSGGTGTTESGLSAGTYTVTVTDGNTCTSTATVAVTSPTALVTTPSQVNVTCFGGSDASATVTVSGGTAGYTYLWTPTLPSTASNSNLIAGTYSCLVTDANGCTSTATFNITEPAPVAVSQTVTICNGDSIVVGSSVYTTAGTYMDTLASVLGCDSTVTTSLMVNPVPSVINVTNAAVCDSGSVVLNANASGGANLTWYSDSALTVNINSGNSYSTPMLYSTTTYYVQADSAGCYSSVSPVTVTVNTGAVTVNQSLSLCFGDSVTIGSSTYYASGVYADTISSGGCDSIINSTITVMPQITATQTLTICSGQAVVVGMNSYNTTGIYMDTLTAMNGCDSLVTTDLTVTLPDSSAQAVTVCNGQSYSIGSNTYTTSGVYADTLTNMSGCDSVVTTTLTVLPANTFTQNITLCAGDSIAVGNNVYSAAGTYNDTIADMNGCDSLITTVVSINNVDVSVSVTGFGGTLNSNASGPNTSWLWYNCQDNTAIISATMQSYTPNANGNFAVIVTQNGCQDTSTCFNITNVGVDEHNNGAFNLYPNPANNFVTIEAQSGAQIIIFDALGNQVDAVNTTSDRTDLSLQNYASGIYLVKVISGEVVTTQRLIINR